VVKVSLVQRLRGNGLFERIVYFCPGRGPGLSKQIATQEGAEGRENVRSVRKGRVRIL